MQLLNPVVELPLTLQNHHSLGSRRSHAAALLYVGWSCTSGRKGRHIRDPHMERHVRGRGEASPPPESDQEDSHPAQRYSWDKGPYLYQEGLTGCNKDPQFRHNAIGMLKKNRRYYYQVQLQIVVCDVHYSGFVVWTKQVMVINRIVTDKDLLLKGLPRAADPTLQDEHTLFYTDFKRPDFGKMMHCAKCNTHFRVQIRRRPSAKPLSFADRGYLTVKTSPHAHSVNNRGGRWVSKLTLLCKFRAIVFEYSVKGCHSLKNMVQSLYISKDRQNRQKEFIIISSFYQSLRFLFNKT